MRPPLVNGLTSMLVLVALGPATAADASRWLVDTAFNSPEFRQTAYPLRTLTDGKGGLYVWGYNNAVHDIGGKRSGFIIKLNLADGKHDTNFHTGTRVLNALGGVVDGQGRPYLGAQLPGDLAAEGQNNRVIRLKADGSLDPAFNSPVFASLPRWLRVQADGKLLVGQGGGNDTGVIGVDRTVRLNTDGSLDRPFSTNTPALGWTATFASPYVDPQGRILLAGAREGAIPLARLLATGKPDTSFVPAGFTVVGGQIRGVELQSNGKIIIGGSFTLPGSEERFALLRLNSSGGLDSTFRLVTTLDAGFAQRNFFGRTRFLRVVAGDKILALGDYGLRRFNGDGSLDLTYPGLDFAEPHFWMDVLPDGGVLIPSETVAGNQVGNATVLGIIKLKPNGTLDPAFKPAGFSEEVFPQTYLMQTDGRILAYGGGYRGFNLAAGVSTKGIARILPTGAIDAGYAPFNLQTDFQGVFSATLAPDNSLYAGINRGPTPFDLTASLIRVTPQGVLDPTIAILAPGVSGLVWQQGGVVIWRNHPQAVLDGLRLLDRLDPSGGVDDSFASFRSATNLAAVTRTAEGIATSIRMGSFNIETVLPDGRMIASICEHPFTKYRLLRLRATGTLDPGFASFSLPALGGGFESYPSLVIPQTRETVQVQTFFPGESPFAGVVPLPGGQLIVYGSFTNYQNSSARGLVRLTADGAVDPSFSVGLGATYQDQTNRVSRLLRVRADPGGSLWVVGYFDHFNGFPAPGIARINSAGAVDPSPPRSLGYLPEAFPGSKPEVLFFGPDRTYLAGQFRRLTDDWPIALTALRRMPLPPPFSMKVTRLFYGLRFEWPSLAGQRYQLVFSSNLKDWANSGQPFLGTGFILVREVSWPPNRYGFFQLQLLDE